jgi:hypothetical protein
MLDLVVLVPGSTLFSTADHAVPAATRSLDPGDLVTSLAVSARRTLPVAPALGLSIGGVVDSSSEPQVIDAVAGRVVAQVHHVLAPDGSEPAVDP